MYGLVNSVSFEVNGLGIWRTEMSKHKSVN